MKTYEEMSDSIEGELQKHRRRWTLDFLSHLDFDDVAQTIRHHIYKKWSNWNQDRPFAPWCSTIIQNQIKNMTRNNYAAFAKPCSKCPYSQGDSMTSDEGFCAITTSGVQCEECPLFAHWIKKRKDAFNVKIPTSIDGNLSDHIETTGSGMNEAEFARGFDELNEEMQRRLSKDMYKAYTMLFIEKASDEEVSKFMGYKTTEKNRAAGYKQIKNLKDKFHTLARKILLDK